MEYAKCSKCHIKCRYVGAGKGPINCIGLYPITYECPKCKVQFWVISPDATLKVKNYSRYRK